MGERLVAKQMRRWELDRKLQQRFQQDESSQRDGPTVIAVSRQWGSGGTSIAKLVARELGFKLYDREIIDHVAEQAGASPDQIATHDEAHHSLVASLVLQMFEGHRPTESVYLRALIQVIRRVGSEGEAVIIGRGAHLILPEAFRVRIIAPEPIRTQRIAELRNMDLTAARRSVAESDQQRDQFMRSFFGIDPKDAMYFDLVINTEHCSIEHAAALIIKGFCDRREGDLEACKASICSSTAQR